MTTTIPSPAAGAGTWTRPPAVAGQFYPADPVELASMIDRLLTEAAAERVHSTPPGSESRLAERPKALIVPHAGYVYSAAVAARAYSLVAAARPTIERVVLLGPAHRVAVRSMALSTASAWATPLGPMTIDAEADRRLSGMAGVVHDDRAHEAEHALEVQVPFLQRLLRPETTLVPIVVGGAPPDEIAAVLDALWGGDETLIVVSSDLSHFHDHLTAQRLDRATAERIVSLLVDELDPSGACGAYPIRGLLRAARDHDLTVELVDLRTSGDTAGTRDRVVGYGSFVLHPTGSPDPNDPVAPVPSTRTTDTGADEEPPATDDRGETGETAPTGGLTDPDRATLLEVATEAIRARLERRTARPAPPTRISGAVDAPGASFVTLRDGERLLGCIGTLEPRRSLVDDVADNALGAAFRDPRLPALTIDEFARMSVHVSVLTAPEPMVVADRDDLHRQIRPGVDGLLIESGHHRGTFLPSVWEQVPDPDDFLTHLWTKAALPAGTWPADLRVSRYRTVEFGDDGPRRPCSPPPPD